jgi:hypothetical protein
MVRVYHYLITPALQITLFNAGSKYLGTDDVACKVFVTSGLGDMRSAQAKAAVVAGCIGVIAEVPHTSYCLSSVSLYFFSLTSFLFFLFPFVFRLSYSCFSSIYFC